MAKKKISHEKIRHKKDMLATLEESKYFAVAAFGVLFIALIWLFSEFVFSNEMLGGSDTLNAGYFFRSFYVDYVRAHFSVPQWNPFIWGGMPFVEAFHGDIFYPLSVIKFFGELKRMLGWILFWHVYLAGIFMYLTARQFKMSKTVSLFSAVCYMFAPYFVSLVAPGHDGKIFVTALFPLTILFVDRAFESKPFLNWSLLGLVIGFIILSPHPQMSYFALWSIGGYTLFKLVRLYLRTRSFGKVVLPAGLSAYAVAVGLLLSAIQFYPGYYYTSHFSPRSETKQGWDWATSWSMHEEEAASLIIPEFCGTSSGKATTFYWGKNAFKDNSEAVGAIVILLALIGVVCGKRRESYFFLALGLFALSYALAGTTPLFKLYFSIIPKVSSMRAASMIMFLFSFSVALVGGFGLQHLRDLVVRRETASKWVNYLLFGFPALLLLFAVLFSMDGSGMLRTWSSLFYGEASTMMVQRNVSKLDIAIMNLPAIQSGLWLAFLFTGAVSVLLLAMLRRKIALWALLGVVAIVMIDDIRFDKRFIDTISDSTYNQKFGNNQLITLLKSKPGKFRVMNFLADQDNTMPFYGIDIPTGYHGNQLKWYDNLVGDLNRSNRFKPGFLNLMGAKYLIFPSNQKLPDGYFGSKPVVEEVNLGQAILYRNENALPRVFLADSFRVVEDRPQIYPQVINMTDELREAVILEERPTLDIRPDSLSADSAWIIEYGIDSIIIGVNTTENRLLVLTDVYFDSWKAFVDARPGKVFRAYGAVRAVEIPAGASRVVFAFDSPRYKTGRLITWLTSLYLLCIVGFYGFRRRKKLKPTETAD